MATAMAVPQEQMKKWETGVNDFCQEIFKKYPSLDGNFIPVLIAEVKALGLMREYISARALWGAFRNCTADGRIALPPVEPVLTEETIQKIRAKFPPVVKSVEKQLTQKEKNALSGTHAQSGRVTTQDRAEENRKIDANYAKERSSRQNASLRREYLELKAKAETVMGDNPRSHAQTISARKEALAKLNADPKFAKVRD